MYFCLRLLILCCYRFYYYYFTTRIFRPYMYISFTCSLDSSYLVSTHGTNIYFLQAATSAINLRNNYSVLFYITTWHRNMHILGFILSFLISIRSLMMALFTSRNVWLIIRIIFNWAEVLLKSNTHQNELHQKHFLLHSPCMVTQNASNS